MIFQTWGLFNVVSHTHVLHFGENRFTSHLIYTSHSLPQEGQTISCFFLIMLTSSAELSHCEQRAQSLFTNQLSSAPGLRQSSVCAVAGYTHAGGGGGWWWWGFETV